MLFRSKLQADRLINHTASSECIACSVKQASEHKEHLSWLTYVMNMVRTGSDLCALRHIEVQPFEYSEGITLTLFWNCIKAKGKAIIGHQLCRILCDRCMKSHTGLRHPTSNIQLCKVSSLTGADGETPICRQLTSAA